MARILAPALASTSGTISLRHGLKRGGGLWGFRNEVFYTPCAAIYNTSSGQSIPNATFTTVNFSTKEYDSDNAVSTGSGWFFLVPASKGGLYQVSATVGFMNYLSNGDMLSTIVVNGAEKCRGVRFTPLNTDSYPYVLVSGLVSVSGGDKIDVRVYQGSGASKGLEATASANRISIHRVGP